MNGLAQHHFKLGARLAADQIPLDYGDQLAELEAGLKRAILLDRSHEGRILLTGRDRLDLVNRMSTNDVARLGTNQGCATIFTNANARILFRAVCLHISQGLLLISEAGQGAALADFLRRNIFFGDNAAIQDISAANAQFALHGPRADGITASLTPSSQDLPRYGICETELDGMRMTLARRETIRGGHWLIICAAHQAAAMHGFLLEAGAQFGLQPAGSLTYNSLRIRSGRPAGLELSPDYLPLEVGLWDEVSFNKGCYTGQEIIARMESRQRLARTLVRLELDGNVAAPAEVSAEGSRAGSMTSSVQAADGKLYALAVLKLAFAKPGITLQVGEDRVEARVKDLAGSQAPFVAAAVAGS